MRDTSRFTMDQRTMVCNNLLYIMNIRTYIYSVAVNTLYLNHNVQHYEEVEEVRRYDEEAQESGVYDPSNLTVTYESDNSNTES